MWTERRQLGRLLEIENRAIGRGRPIASSAALCTRSSSSSVRPIYLFVWKLSSVSPCSGSAHVEICRGDRQAQGFQHEASFLDALLRRAGDDSAACNFVLAFDVGSRDGGRNPRY